ncbi:MAG: response regulator [Limnobacter sp.]|nr:response regulator [Limnobacter sp.]
MLSQDKLVSLLDIESVCQRVLPVEDSAQVKTVQLDNPAPVFFVDDSRVARRQITSVLDSMGLKHSHAVNGDEAQSKLMGLVSAVKEDETVHEKIGLILVDEEMPGMDGCSLTRNLRADKRFKDVPIIMYSSLTSDENERRGLQAGHGDGAAGEVLPEMAERLPRFQLPDRE